MVGIPAVSRRARLPDSVRRRLGGQLLHEYDSGKSIRHLCAETGYSIGRMRRLLQAAGVQFRDRGAGP